MGQIVDFEATKAVLIGAVPDPDQAHLVNLGVGDEVDELLLLLQGQRMMAVQLGDDELWEVATLYQRARKWVDLDILGGPLPYETLELINENGVGVSLLCDTAGLTGLQLIIHQGTTVLAIEEELLKDFHKVMGWFLLHVVLIED